MTDEPARDTRPVSEPVPPRTQVDLTDPSRKRDPLPILYVAGFVVLAGSIYYLWQHPSAPPQVTEQAGRVENLQGEIAALREQVGKLSQVPAGPNTADFTRLQQQVAGLANRPALAPDALAALSTKVDGLERRPAVAPDAVQALAGKVTALEGRPAVAPATVDALAGKLSALEAKPTVAPEAVQQLTDKLAAIEARKVVTPEQLSLLSDQVQSVGRQIPDIKPLEQKVAALEQRPTYDPAAVGARLSDLATKLQQSQETETRLATRLDAADKQGATQADLLKTLTQRAQVTARLQGMAVALAAGQKLGDIPGAPPALARFATEAPPTEAALRESFDGFAEAAQRASQPAITDKQDFGARLWTRAQQAVTVRQGDRVLVGDPIAGVMTRAREKLDNGDLAGSVEALKSLAGPAAAAMQPWTDKAQSLVAARAAIASLAAN